MRPAISMIVVPEDELIRMRLRAEAAEAAIRHALTHGRMGKQTRRRLKDAIRSANPGAPVELP